MRAFASPLDNLSLCKGHLRNSEAPANLYSSTSQEQQQLMQCIPLPKCRTQMSTRASVLKGDCAYCVTSSAFSHRQFVVAAVSRLSQRNHGNYLCHVQNTRSNALFARRRGIAGCNDEAQQQLPVSFSSCTQAQMCHFHAGSDITLFRKSCKIF